MSTVENRETASCWNQTGVWGTGQCPRLREVIHCRHCTVYTSAGSRALDREVPIAESALTDSVSTPPPVAREADSSAVLFRVRAEWFGLHTTAFSEISEPGPIHTIPHRTNPVLLGLANIRGELLVCASLSHLLGMEGNDEVPGTGRFMVIRAPKGRLVLPVSEVFGIRRYASADVKPAPATVTGSRAAFTSGVLEWDDQSVGLLETENVLKVVQRSFS